MQRDTDSSAGGLATSANYSESGDLNPVGGAESSAAYTGTGGFLGGETDPLLAIADTLVRLNTTAVAKLPISALLANDTDEEGYPLTITAVGNATPAGASVAIVGHFVVYVAPGATAGHGSFTYTLSDGPGGHTVAGTVTVTETAPPVPTIPPNARIALVGGDVVLTYLGVPFRTYGVQYSTNTRPPYTWNEFSPPTSLVAPPSGVITYTDASPGGPVRFYRFVLQP